MKFIDWFAGVGGFRRGMELAGHECVGFCEFDKFATASYTSMHLITDEQRKTLAEMPIKKRQKEILKDEYRNGEWYANDIRAVHAGSMPKADCWCFGSPCQDFSIAGNRKGLDGDRSSLIREVFRILEEWKEEDRPEWIIYENVKGMFSSNRGLDYLSILSEMDRLGYDIEWQNINSKWFVPQNRERIYTIGHLRASRRCSGKIFPIERANGENRVFQIGGLLSVKGRNQNAYRVYDPKGISPCLNTSEGGGREPCFVFPLFCDLKINSGEVNNRKGMTKRYAEISGVAIDLKAFTSKTRGQPFRYGYVGTLDHNCKHGVFVTLEDKTGYAIWSEKHQCYIVIRRLTPREYFRLQGWTDDYFEKAEFVNSDSQLYKQAGNSVTVNVIEAIANNLNTESEN